MADIIVRRLDDKVKERLRKRAMRHGRSLEAEARVILQQASEPGPEEHAVQLEKSFGDIMGERFRTRGFTKTESIRFRNGMREINSTFEMSIPDFDN